MIITVVGAGPRGLAAALYAWSKGHEVNLIDPKPIYTWDTDYLISNLEMRSPATFDLVTYLDNLQRFSLSRFLQISLPFSKSQVDIESNTNKISRGAFSSYLHYIVRLLKSRVNLIEKKVINTQGNTVILEDLTTISSDAVIFCVGYKGYRNIPTWLSSGDLRSKLIQIPDILKDFSQYVNKSWLVIGSGQGSAEVTEYLCNLNGSVSWLNNYKLKIYQYPAPDFMLWGSRSALGGHYRTLKTAASQLSYLSRVKGWQPSITPYIKNKLDLVNDNYKIVTVNSYSDILNINADHIVLAAGIKPSISAIPTTTYIPFNPFNSNFPDIQTSFKLNVPDTNWYVSGILATAFDGPRQHSLISAGITAKEIIEHIEYGNI